MRTRWNGSKVGAVLVGLGALAGAAHAAEFRGLGALSSDVFSRANAISSDGTTVVGVANTATGSAAFVWRVGDASVTPLPGLPGQANGVSADGSVIVGISGSALDQRATRWVRQSNGSYTAQNLGSLPTGFDVSNAQGVSGDGQTVVGFGSVAGGNEGFRWTPGGGLNGVGFLAPNLSFNFSQLRDVSADGGVAVGIGLDAEAENRAILHRPGVGLTNLGLAGTLEGGLFNYNQSNGQAVNDLGTHIVGNLVASNEFEQFANEGFRWSEADGMVPLGDLAGGPVDSVTFDVSNDGAVIVGYGTDAFGADGRKATRWSTTFGLQTLQSVLAGQGLVGELSGWTLTEARGVSADGMSFVGVGTNPNGDTEAWWATLRGAAVQSGDFTGNGQVEQGDLNLVLNNWGDARGVWSNADGFATNNVDQEELNAVLNNWGSGNAPNFASHPAVVPEPVGLIGLGVLSLLGSRGRAKALRSR